MRVSQFEHCISVYIHIVFFCLLLFLQLIIFIGTGLPDIIGYSTPLHGVFLAFFYLVYLFIIFILIRVAND